jgi:hypothetical protein
MQVTAEPDNNSFSLDTHRVSLIKKIYQKINAIFLAISSIFILLLTLIISPIIILCNILTELNINFLINTGNIQKVLLNIEKQKDLELRIKWFSKVVAYYESRGNSDLANKYAKEIENLKFQLTYNY